jgi:hypothetical protein
MLCGRRASRCRPRNKKTPSAVGNSQQQIGVSIVLWNAKYRARYDTMSLSFFSGRTFTTLRAGLALNVVGSPVNGFVP